MLLVIELEWLNMWLCVEDLEVGHLDHKVNSQLFASPVLVVE